MTVQRFLNTIEKLNIDFDDMIFVYEDSETGKSFYQLLDEDEYDLFYEDILENHLDELEYLYSRISDDFIITIDRDSVERVIYNYDYEISL